MPDLYSQLSDITLLRRAWHLARHYSRSHFIADAYRYSDFAYRLDDRLRHISQSLALQTYHPSPPLKIDIPKSTLSVRPGTVLEIEDMIVLFAITLSIARQLDRKLPDSVYSWRVKENSDEIFKDIEILRLPFLKGETIRRQIDISESWYEQWPEFIEEMEYAYEKQGYTFLVISDIAAYFENLDLKVLRDILVSHLPKQIRIINFLVTMLEYWAWPAVHGSYSPRGIPQGNAVSSFLGNIYLLPLDEAFTSFGKSHDIKYFRYMDDVKVFAKEKMAARESLFLMNEKLRSLRLNIQGAKTRILEGPDLRSEFFDPELAAVNKLIDQIRRKRTITAKQRDEFQKMLWRYVQSIGGRKGVIKDRAFRLFRRLITAYTLIKHSGLVRHVIEQMERNPDARLSDKWINYIRFLRGNQKVAAQRIAALLAKERELFPFQQASLLMALRYLLILEPETWSQVWRLSRLRSINWNTRRQAALLLSMKGLGRIGLSWSRQAFEKEDNVEVKRAWIQCLTQLPREELEELSRSLTLSVHSKIQRLGQYFDGLLSDETYGLAQIESIFREGREDILIDRLYALEVLAKSRSRKVQSALLSNISNGQIKYSRPLLKGRLNEIGQQIKKELGGEQLGLL